MTTQNQQKIMPLKEEIEYFIQKKAFEHFPSNLSDAAHYILSLPGKRLRPLMTLLVAEGFGIPTSQAMSAAISMEVFHNFTLVHDDIMDKAPLRRGKATVHEIYGMEKAILTGDAMMPHAIGLLIKDNEDKIKALTQSFLKMSCEVMEGQQFDIDFEKQKRVAIDDYLNMIRLKTSVLFGCACEVGAILGKASREDQQKIYDFGVSIGLAFQIMDDYLDTFGDTSFGKRIGGDILLNKQTFLFIHACLEANPNQLYQIESLMEENDETKKIHGFQQIFREIGVDNIALNTMDSLHQEAVNSIHTTQLSKESKEQLIQLSGKMLYRTV